MNDRVRSGARDLRRSHRPLHKLNEYFPSALRPGTHRTILEDSGLARDSSDPSKRTDLSNPLQKGGTGLAPQTDLIEPCMRGRSLAQLTIDVLPDPSGRIQFLSPGPGSVWLELFRADGSHMGTIARRIEQGHADFDIAFMLEEADLQVRGKLRWSGKTGERFGGFESTNRIDDEA